MARGGASTRTGVSICIVSVFVTLRLVATFGAGVRGTPDSPSYFVFRFWGAMRFPVITGFYALVGDHRFSLRDSKTENFRSLRRQFF